MHGDASVSSILDRDAAEHGETFDHDLRGIRAGRRVGLIFVAAKDHAARHHQPGCTIEAHNFQRDLPKYEQGNTVIVGVSVDSTDSHKDFCAKQGLTFKLLADTNKKLSNNMVRCDRTASRLATPS